MMAWRLPVGLRLRHWSNGVRVTRAAGLAIAAANRARDRRDWAAAAAAYRAALDRDPGLGPIWVQYGHALKEAGDRAAALDAYRQAVRADPSAADASLYVGHLARDSGALAEAADAYLNAATIDPTLTEAVFAFVRVRGRTDDTGLAARQDSRVATLVASLGTRLAAPLPPDALDMPDPIDGELAYDVTDLLAYLGRTRIPTGIQRVQLEILLDLLARDDGRVRRMLCFAPGRSGWIAIPGGLFRMLMDASRHGDDTDAAEWQALLGCCYLALVDRTAHAFPPRSALVNLGTNWMDPDYLIAVQQARERHGMRFVALVFDIIPVLRPDLFVETLARDFRRWMQRLFTVANGYVAISRQTATDLQGFAAACGTPIAPHAITVMPLDVDFRTIVRRPPDRTIAGLGLGGRRYVLMVSTLEPRKNHLGAFAAWQCMAGTIGDDRMPLLVCVGGKGWLNADIHAALATTPRLARHVRLLSGISDTELAMLYAGSLFTLYPSLYEGWGLPITESLCYGKIPAVSNTASMPEAGGTLAIYFDPHDPADIAAKLLPLIRDDAARAAHETRIAATFRPRRWSAVADQIEAAAAPNEP